MKEFILSVTSGLVGGLIVLFVQKFIESKAKKRQEQESRVVNPAMSLKILPKNILQYLHVGLGIEKMKDFLGVPYEVRDSIHMEFLDFQEVDIKSYFYRFSNATMLILSRDNKMIDSISIFNHSEEGPFIEVNFPGYDPLVIGQSLVTLEFAEDSRSHFNIVGRREMYFGIERYFGVYGDYFNYSCFGSLYDSDLSEKYKNTKDPSLFVGHKVVGINISNTEGYAPYISIYQ